MVRLLGIPEMCGKIICSFPKLDSYDLAHVVHRELSSY